MGCENREVSEDFTSSFRSSHSSKYLGVTQSKTLPAHSDPVTAVST